MIIPAVSLLQNTSFGSICAFLRETYFPHFSPVVVEMEEGVSDVKTPPNDSDASPLAFPGTFQQVSAEPLPVEPSDDNPARSTRRRSLIWRLFEHVESLNAARCLICMKKLHESGGVSNLRRHLNKRHPKVLSELLASSHQRPSLEDGADVGIHENEHDPGKLTDHRSLFSHA